MERKEWIDITKGIGIIAVVAGHIYVGNIKLIIFMFHMPLFFFLSGYLFNPKHDKKKYFKKKVIHLLVPYVMFLLLIYYGFFFIINKEHIDILGLLIKPIIGGRFLINETGVFWFVPVLFITQQLMNFLFVKTSLKYTLIIVILFLSFSYVNSLFLPKIWFPLNLNVVFASIPIFYIGYYVKKLNIKDNYILLFVGLIVIFITVFLIPQNTYDMKYSNYGLPIITLFSGVLLTLNIKQIAIFLSKIKLINHFLSKLGNASMVIMFLHLPCKILIERYISTNYTVQFFLATTISYVLYIILKKNIYLRAFFLGSNYDIEAIKSRYKK